MYSNTPPAPSLEGRKTTSNNDNPSRLPTGNSGPCAEGMGIAPECDGADAYGYGKDARAGEHSGGIFRKGTHCGPPGGVGGADQEYGGFLLGS